MASLGGVRGRGTGTSALTFSYTVASGENTSDLAVTAFNLPASATLNQLMSVRFLSPGGIPVDYTTPSPLATVIEPQRTGVVTFETSTTTTALFFESAM